MLTSDECRAKAADLAQRAEQAPALREELLLMARTWLELAVTAHWQDVFEKHLM